MSKYKVLYPPLPANSKDIQTNPLLHTHGKSRDIMGIIM